MNEALRRLSCRGLMVAVLWLAVAPIARAQEKPPLPPEVISILGEPDGPKDGLDAAVVGALGQPEGPVPANETAINVKSASVAVKLRCPVCQGVAVSDSPSGMAVKMRGQIRELVAHGYSEEQVLSYFERSYGEFVRLDPPMEGLNLLLWILPGVVLLGGFLLVLYKARQPVPVRASVQDAPRPPSEAAADVDPALAKYLERIRRDSGSS